MNKRRLWLIRATFPFTLMVVILNWFLEQVADRLLNWIWRYTARYLRWHNYQLDLAWKEATEDRQ